MTYLDSPGNGDVPTALCTRVPVEYLSNVNDTIGLEVAPAHEIVNVLTFLVRAGDPSRSAHNPRVGQEFDPTRGINSECAGTDISLNQCWVLGEVRFFEWTCYAGV